MPEYIEQEAAIRAIKGRFSMPVDNLIAEVIESMTAADVKPVRHGRWLDGHGERNCSGGIVCADAACSVCGKRSEMGYCYPELLPYCPNCGAKMDLEETK